MTNPQSPVPAELAAPPSLAVALPSLDIEQARGDAHVAACMAGHYGASVQGMVDAALDNLSASIAEQIGLAVAGRDREIDRLAALVEGRFKDAAKLELVGLGPCQNGGGGVQVDIRGEGIGLIAEHLAETFKVMGGQNYVAMELSHDELGPLVLTMQRLLGKTPAVVAAELRAELAEAKAEITALECALEEEIHNDERTGDFL